jgi:sugar lactone lactonase YvrE
MQDTNQQKKRPNILLWAFLALAGMVSVCALCVAANVIGTGVSLVSFMNQPTNTPYPIHSAFAEQEMTIMHSETAPEALNFPRYIGLDRSGNIYVGNAGGGTIAIFDPSGTFQRLIPVADKGSTMYGMAVTPDGIIYLSVDGNIQKIDSQGNKSAVPYDKIATGTSDLRDINLAPDGSLLAMDSSGNILRFDGKGNSKLVVKNPFEVYLQKTESWSTFAVDRSGNIYVLGESNCLVLKLDPEGKLLSQFGGETHNHVYRGWDDTPGAVPSLDPGFFYQPVAITVDNFGRVLVSDSTYDVQVFDVDGKFMDSFATPEVVMWMIFDQNNNLFISNDAPEVARLSVRGP